MTFINRLITCSVGTAVLCFGAAVGAQEGGGAQPGMNPPPSAGQPGAREQPPTGQQPGATEEAAREGAKAVGMEDTKFAQQAATGVMAQIQMGQLAAQRGTTPEVKQLGQRIVDDHGKVNDQLQQIAQTKNITLPSDLNRDQQKTLARLQSLTGDKFDKEYLKVIEKAHKDDIKAFETEAKKGQDPELRSFAEQTLPTLRQHYDMAKADMKAKPM